MWSGQAINEDGQNNLRSILARRRKIICGKLGQMGSAAERLSRLGKKVSRHKPRNTEMLNKRQDIFQNAIEGKLRVQDRAGERLQDQIIEEIKELESTTDRRILAKKGERA